MTNYVVEENGEPSFVLRGFNEIGASVIAGSRDYRRVSSPEADRIMRERIAKPIFGRNIVNKLTRDYLSPQNKI